MLIKQPKISIISREVTGYSGERLIAYFAVIETAGVPEIRFIGTRPAPLALAQEEAVLALPGAIARRFGEVVERIFESVVISPLSTLAFLVSQPARAPNLA
ncbi:MAG: hypothetical protein WC767_01445 [Candidatus Paceibacterota bacterium]|jgi:hypothetical protein